MSPSCFVALAAILSIPGANLPSAPAAEPPDPLVGIAVRDITPEPPIRLAGYGGRKRPADKVDNPLTVQALALKNQSGERFIIVALDNLEVSRAFMQPVLQDLTRTHQLARGSVVLVSSHSHSAPVLDKTLTDMAQPATDERVKIQEYSGFLKTKLVEVVTAALADFQPASFELGTGTAGFAMNRRVFRDGKTVFGDNPDGPVDRAVPVLRIRSTNGAVRAVVFGYACHGTSVRTGDDWYTVSGEYMSYAREHIQNAEPGAVAMFLTGMGADADPAPRGLLMHARRHGLELGGAVVGVLDRPMRPVHGPFKFAYEELQLPLASQPSREQIEKDAVGSDPFIRTRARSYLDLLQHGKTLPQSVPLSISILRFGNDLTFAFMGGEVVVDYSRRLKELLGKESVWPVGYAYEVPCYIPSARIIKEGGYETETSLIYYGYYGPLQPSIEEQILTRFQALFSECGGKP